MTQTELQTLHAESQEILARIEIQRLYEEFQKRKPPAPLLLYPAVNDSDVSERKRLALSGAVDLLTRMHTPGRPPKAFHFRDGDERDWEALEEAGWEGVIYTWSDRQIIGQYVKSSDAIWVADELDGSELVGTIAHEFKHRLDLRASETECDEFGLAFARKFAPGGGVLLGLVDEEPLPAYLVPTSNNGDSVVSLRQRAVYVREYPWWRTHSRF